MLESIMQLAYQSRQSGVDQILRPDEVTALRTLESFQHSEHQVMHEVLASSEAIYPSSPASIGSVQACCRASEFVQRRRLLELICKIYPSSDWVLEPQWKALRASGNAVFQAASILVAWMHQRFDLYYMAQARLEDALTSPFDVNSVRPFFLRTLSVPPAPRLRRSRLAGWRCDRESDNTTCASLLVVPSLRDPAPMVEAMRIAVAARSGPFHRKPAANQGVVVTELAFEVCS